MNSVHNNDGSAAVSTLYQAKPAFQALLRPAAARLAAAGIGADAVTLATLALSLGYGGLLWASGGSTALLLALPAVLLLRMALNALDGLLAREHGRPTPFGGRLNEVGDLAADLVLYLPLAAVLAPAWPVVLLVALGTVAETAGLAAQAQGGERRYDGPFGKADRALFFGLVALAEATLGLTPPLVTALFLAASAAALLTCLRRLRGGLDHG